MDIIKIMKERHSVRQYQNKSIEIEKQSALNQLIENINANRNLHIQIFYNEPKCFDSVKAHYGKLTGVQNYICLVGTKSKTLEEQLGYYGEKIVLKAQELGLNTCWVALTHGKSEAVIGKDEKEVCLISLGYGVKAGVPHKSKPLDKVCNFKEGMPEWFLNGVEAALLAPTAVNQQKFYLEFVGNNKVKASCGLGFYTKLDLGIVKYHFEAVTNKKVEWL